MGGLGYKNSKSIAYIVKVGSSKRSKAQTETLVKYLRKVSPFLSKADHSLLVTLLDKLSISEVRKGRAILNQDEEDNVHLIILEGIVSKVKDGKIVTQFDKNSVIGDDVLRQPFTMRKYRNYSIVANTDVKVLICTKSSF